MSGCKEFINKCMFKVAILYSYYLFTRTLFYLADCSFNRCQKYVYDKLANTVLCIVLVKTAVQVQAKYESGDFEEDYEDKESIVVLFYSQ